MKFLQDIWVFRELILPTIDILVVFYLIYRVYLIIAETRAIAALKGLILILVVTLGANFFGLETLGWLLERFLGVAAIALIVLFQPELRRVLMKVGQGRLLTLYMDDRRDYLKDVAEAVEFMANRKVGPLIAFERGVGLKNYVETGTALDAALSFELLVSIFSKESPMHDGAVIIQHKRVSAAGCFLPLTMRRDIRKEYGTRHRAAIGLSEETDAAVLVVSEETGDISLAMDGKIRSDIRQEKIAEVLAKALGEQQSILPSARRKKK